MGRGDLVSWTYMHHINNKSYTHITKQGVIIKFIGEKKNTRFVSGKYALVQLEGNKYPSKILCSELELVKSQCKIIS